MKHGLDIIGNIAIINFHKNYLSLRKKLLARKILRQIKNITTVLEKQGNIYGKLRKFKTKHLAGEKTKTTIHKENNCVFKLNIDDTYFSPRLSNERKIICEEIAKKVKNNSNILVMFAGIAPFPIVLGKMLKQNKKSANIISSELNAKANKYAEENIRLNKLQQTIKLIPGNSKDLPRKIKQKFDVILMPRPNLKETFLPTALKLSKKGTIIFYHGFGKTAEEIKDEIKNSVEEIKPKKKISKIKIRKAGDIAPGKWRWLAEFKVQ